MLRWILHPAASEGTTIPLGSDMQSFLLEIVITFVLMFVVAAVATDTRAVRYPSSTSHTAFFFQGFFYDSCFVSWYKFAYDGVIAAVHRDSHGNVAKS
jgi:glycerol uptake facilitator-like aquaporin